MARLRRLKADRAERLLHRGVGQTEQTPILAKPDGTQMAHQTLAGAFGKFVEAEGFDVSFHSLRHTAAIHMLTAGVDVKTAAARLGHNPSLLLQTYAHFVPSADRQAADRLGAALAF